MIPVMMRPNDGADCTSIDIDTVLAQDFRHVFGNVDVPVILDELWVGWQFVPVLADAKVEENRF